MDASRSGAAPAPPPGARPLPHFVLYSRSWCHLCDDLRDALAGCMARLGQPYRLDVVDVDADPALVARYDELVPVLTGADGAELCHHFLDEAAVERHVAAQAPAAA